MRRLALRRMYLVFRECHVRGWKPVSAALCDHRARSSKAHPSSLCSLRLTVSKIAHSIPKACPNFIQFVAMAGTTSLRMSNRDGLAPTQHTMQADKHCMNSVHLMYNPCILYVCCRGARCLDCVTDDATHLAVTDQVSHCLQ